jgi:molybdenum cofactor biosynthesis enzyme MoaA
MFCCRIKNGDFVSPRIKWKASFEETLVEWVAKREDISEVIKTSKPHKCKDCPIITKMPLSAQKKICSLTYSLPFLCQFSCIYCKSEERNLKEEANQFWKSFDLTRIIRHLEERCLISKKATIFFGGGEITIFPYKDDLLSSIKEYNVHIPTNALIFDSFVAELTARPGSILSISPDAGTKETFRLIKGVSAFDDVWKSIARYSELGSNIDLKYIFLPENSNCSDVEGFVYRAMNAGVNRIYCSTNYYRNESLSAQQIDAVVKMTDMAKKCGITILRDYSFKNEENDEICRQLECS